MFSKKQKLEQKQTEKKIHILKFKKEGQYPRKTKNWLRYRKEDPEKFSIFRIKKVSPKTELVLGKLKRTGRWVIQSVMKKRK